MRRAQITAAVSASVVAMAALALAAPRGASQVPTPTPLPSEKVTICHATGSVQNPYSQLDVPLDADLNGHLDHPNDIIPPFEFDGGGYLGQNWDARGQLIWAMDCDAKELTPLLDCVEERPRNLLVAHFGYRNEESRVVTIDIGLANMFAPPPENRAQPTEFQTGTHRDVFTVPFTGESLSWRLAGESVTASEASRRCQASLRIDKALDPTNDPGSFDLLLDGTALATGVGDGGTTGTVAVTAAPGGTPHTVGERAAGGSGTSLADYDTTIVCRDNDGRGTVVAEDEGTSLTVPVRDGQAIVCVILNARRPPPGTGQADLQIVKSASPASVLVGGQVTWTVVVTNNGPTLATNVVIEDSLPEGVSFVDGSLSVTPGVTCTGAICRLASLAPNASASGQFITTATAVGEKTNTVTVDADQDDLNPANNAASAHVLVTSRVVADVIPVLECVERLSGGSYRAHFGYLNRGSEAVSVPIGVLNAFTPAPEDRGQPRVFQPGRAPDVFQVAFEGTLAWTLEGRTATASPSSEGCPPPPASLRVDKLLQPFTDPGRFDLEIDGVVAGTGSGAGHLGTTGDVAVNAGRHRVGEEGTGGTSLADYNTTIVCRGDRGRGPVISAGEGPELLVDVPAGTEVVCTILNTRRSAPTPPPQPPDPPAPSPLPPPAPGSADLSVRKFVDRAVGRLGDIVTWTVVVTNHGPLAATGVNIVDRAAAGATFVSLTVPQGTCARTTCALGTIAPGRSVRIVARTRALVTGARLNGVGGAGDQPDSNLENNVASALVRIVSSFTPPLQQRCSDVTVNRRVARAGATVPVRVTVRNVFGRPLAGTAVLARGAGQSSSARTNARGIATMRLAPTTPGIVQFTVGARALTAAGARRCTARLGVVGTGGLAPGVTGVTG